MIPASFFFRSLYKDRWERPDPPQEAPPDGSEPGTRERRRGTLASLGLFLPILGLFLRRRR